MNSKRSRFVGIMAILSALVGGFLIGSAQSGCGAVEGNACAGDTCEQGPPGPQGERGPAGPAGATGPAGAPADFASCQVMWVACNTAPGTECYADCPAGKHPVGGGCDMAAGNAATESVPVPAVFPPFPDTGSSITAYKGWECEAATGTVQSAYAICC